jgi:hypothetical protein
MPARSTTNSAATAANDDTAATNNDTTNAAVARTVHHGAPRDIGSHAARSDGDADAHPRPRAD